MDNRRYRLTKVNGTRMYEHRAVLERKLGRKLQKGEITHHRNERKKDNRPANLAPTTRSAHAKLHFPNGPWSGKTHSPATRRRISTALRGRRLPLSTRRKMSTARKGLRWGPEPERRAAQARRMAQVNPRWKVSRRAALTLRAAGKDWREIATTLGVSYRTLRRRRIEWNL